MKLCYYIKNFLLGFYPSYFFSLYHKKLEAQFSSEAEAIQRRVDYYCKLTPPVELSSNAKSRATNYKLRGKSAYYYDLKQYLYYFPKHFKFCYYFGDRVTIEDCPTLYKARPIEGDNQNSVLFKLDKYRHFRFIKDTLPFHAKKNKAVFRGNVFQKHRIRFMNAMFEHPLVDAGQTNASETHPHWQKPFMSVKEQLQYKFLICLEGNDVATNLKWSMSSNSIIVTPKMRCETWFMEGLLAPGVHFIQVEDDWSDFDEKIRYYLDHPHESERILQNAHQHVMQFKNARREDLVCIKTLEKYFSISQQQ